ARLEPIYDVCQNIAKRERHRVAGQGNAAMWGGQSWPQPAFQPAFDTQGNAGQGSGGPEKDVLVHRKGATRAFPPGHPGIPPAYRAIGQPVLVPGSMGTASWILVGAPGAMQQTFGSVCHGAGRLMSRTAAKKGRNAQEVQRRLLDQGIFVRSETRDGILEEIPEAYKDVDEVIEVVDRAGLARKVARLRPIGVIKG